MTGEASTAEAGEQEHEGHRPDGPGPAGHGPDDHGDAMFPHVGRWSRGYDPDAVDSFFAQARLAYEGPLAETLSSEDVRAAAFDLVSGGYRTAAVDAALDRLESAFARRERAAFVAEHGKAAWTERTASLARTLQPRALRPAGQRFAEPTHGGGYAAQDVDALVDRLQAFFDADTPLTAVEVRTATFRPAKGRRAYAEGPVDAYLDRAVKVLLALE